MEGKYTLTNSKECIVEAKKYYHYSYEKLADGTSSLCAQTLYDRCSDIDTKTEYRFDKDNTKKLQLAVGKITSEEIEIALVRIFFAFTHVESWFDERGFEAFCLENEIIFQKSNAEI
jgi:hypothetical protein